MTFVSPGKEKVRPRRFKVVPVDILESLDYITKGLPSMDGWDPWKPSYSACEDNDDIYKKIYVDMKHFGLDQIEVEIVDGFVQVKAWHPETKDAHGWISRKFTRRYKIEGNSRIDDIETKLSADGILTITVPKEQTASVGSVPIILTGVKGRKCGHQRPEFYTS